MNKMVKISVNDSSVKSLGSAAPVYLESLSLVERLHRGLLDVVKDEFDRRGRSDVNPVKNRPDEIIRGQVIFTNQPTRPFRFPVPPRAMRQN